MANTTIFENASVFDGIASELAEAQTVVVEADRIKEVSDRPVDIANAQRIDLRGRTLMPGLIDAHFHAIAAHPDLKIIEDMDVQGPQAMRRGGSAVCPARHSSILTMAVYIAYFLTRMLQQERSGG